MRLLAVTLILALFILAFISNIERVESIPISLLNPNFESGDFAGWTTINDDVVSNTIIVSSTDPINGSFSANFDYQIDTGNKRLTAFQNIPSQDDTTFQFLVNITNDNLLPSKGVVLGGIKNASDNDASINRRAFVIYNHNSTNGLEFIFGFQNDVGVDLTTITQANINQVFCITIRYLRSPTPNTGLVTFLVDDILILNATIDNDGMTPHDTIFNGVFNNMPSNQGIDLAFTTDANRAFSGPTTLAEINCPTVGGVPPTPPTPPITIGENSLQPSGLSVIFIFMILGFLALASKEPWVIVAGWLSMTISFLLFTNGIVFFALNSNSQIISITTVFPQEFNTNIFRFFIIMMFVYPIRIFVLVYERLKSILGAVSDRLA